MSKPGLSSSRPASSRSGLSGVRMLKPSSLIGRARSSVDLRVLGVVHVPHGPVRADAGQAVEVVGRRRRAGGPLERVAAPRVVARDLTLAMRAPDVPEER